MVTLSDRKSTAHGTSLPRNREYPEKYRTFAPKGTPCGHGRAIIQTVKKTKHMSSRLSKLNARIWRHKYFWTIVIFSVHLGFIDANSLWYRYRLTRENKATLKEIAYYEKSFENDRDKLKRLSSDPEALIRVARENHQMKAADEDVYYIVENSDSLPEAPANP